MGNDCGVKTLGCGSMGNDCGVKTLGCGSMGNDCDVKTVGFGSMANDCDVKTWNDGLGNGGNSGGSSDDNVRIVEALGGGVDYIQNTRALDRAVSQVWTVRIA
ncbi:hypothetical protein AVEN_204360-1 [Araneus ventricosus]|uniref:Uncharacterized protein n=1 Tax=Araneus ventricosus TaxID=182803 RepID=A0A4Y2VKC6_ARAVE|nr:hypothetical protein AVEN_170881-1 [Araneus ventricosus]GBO25716.1 hypothetical protein AVEN_204360-1 [Araneus ventricosus]